MYELWEWDAAKEQVLILCFEAQISRREIAAKCGIAERTLDHWVKHPEFQQRLAELRTQLVEHMTGVAFIAKESRLLALSEMALRAKANFLEREILTETRPVPGGVLINESFNSGAFTAFLNATKAIADELGARKQSIELSGHIEETRQIIVQAIDVPPELVDQYIRVGTKISKGGEIYDALPAPAAAVTPQSNADDTDDTDDADDDENAENDDESATSQLPAIHAAVKNVEQSTATKPPTEVDIDAQAAELSQLLRSYGFFDDAQQADILARYMHADKRQTNTD